MIELDGLAAAVTESAGSWRRIASSSSRSCSPSSSPNSSSSTRLPSRKTARASACRPALYRASMSCARGRSSNGRWATSASSSGTSSGPRPSARSASIRSSNARRRSSSRRADSVCTNCSYAKSASGSPRQSERAERSVVARSAGSSRLGAFQEPLELVEVELARPHAQEVPGAVCLQRVSGCSECLAKVGDVYLDRLRGGPRNAARPKVVREPIRRDDLVRVEEQDREQGALPRCAQIETAITVESLEWAKDPELHGATVLRFGTRLYRVLGPCQPRTPILSAKTAEGGHDGRSIMSISKRPVIFVALAVVVARCPSGRRSPARILGSTTGRAWFARTIGRVHVAPEPWPLPMQRNAPRGRTIGPAPVAREPWRLPVQRNGPRGPTTGLGRGDLVRYLLGPPPSSSARRTPSTGAMRRSELSAAWALPCFWSDWQF